MSNNLPQWIVVAYVFGVVDEVTANLVVLEHLQPDVRPGPDTLVFITLLVRELTADAAGTYAKIAIERALRRSAMVQSVIQASTLE